MNGLVEECHCGHHKDTHYQARFDCLGMNCDCNWYADKSKPEARIWHDAREKRWPTKELPPGILTPELRKYWKPDT